MSLAKDTEKMEAGQKRPTVALICRKFWNKSGGTQRSVARLSTVITRAGFDTTIWSVKRGNVSDQSVNLTACRTNLMLRKQIRTKNPDIAIVFGSSRSDYKLAADLSQSGQKVLFSEESEPLHALKRWGAPIPRSKNVAAAERLYFISCLAGIRCLRRDIFQSLPLEVQNRAVVIPNYFDHSLVRSVEQQEPRPFFTFVVVGSDRPWKNVDSVVQAHCKMVEKGSNSRLNIYGRSLDLKQSTLRMMNPKFQRFLGFQADRVALHRSGDVLVIPSHSEGVSTVALEAAGLGIPVLAFQDCRGVTAVIRDGVNGMLIDSDVSDVQSLFEAMSKLEEDKDFTDGLRGRSLESQPWLTEVNGETAWKDWLDGVLRATPNPRAAMTRGQIWRLRCFGSVWALVNFRSEHHGLRILNRRILIRLTNLRRSGRRQF